MREHVLDPQALLGVERADHDSLRGGTAEEFGSGLLECAFGIDRQGDEDGVLGEFRHG